MIQNIFKRVEQKYLLTEKQYLSLIKTLNNHLKKDTYFKSEIYNIYFDNDNNDMIINSIEKPEYKEKIRLRSYQNPKENDIVFFEIKKKYKKTVYKRRINLTLKEFNNYLNNNYDFTNNQIMKEIDYYIKYYKLHPSIFIAYDRISYYLKEDKNLRITFDTNLRSRRTNLVLKDTKENKLYFNEKMYIMEIKSLYGLPLWFVKILSENNIYPISFSKIGNIYTKERQVISC